MQPMVEIEIVINLWGGMGYIFSRGPRILSRRCAPYRALSQLASLQPVLPTHVPGRLFHPEMY
jgi:hypothetical protein